MAVLLDTHIVIAFLRNSFRTQFPQVHRLLEGSAADGYVSVASLWEIAIKHRLGKLDIDVPLERIPDSLTASGLTILPIEIAHVLTAADPEPPTRDPFDRLLLAQCQVEGLQLVTIDRALVEHPLAFRF
ncbi:type II toxin-antitoxin system VapC family toxin [Allorhizobium pseudoryzae]|uniref:type II toxin-antitoxin system VapC family toxin n=1 Tax=Allorhizobium pseudoryzae TaxID=379684 RepID=UPI003CFC6ECD